MRIHQRLTTALREWIGADRSETFLLRGGLLEQVHGWAGTTSFRLSNLEQEFIDASVTERDREVEQARQRELRAATAERRERQRLRQLAAVGIVAVLVTALAVFGTVQWRSAANAKDDVDDLLTVSDLVSASETALVDDPELSLLLAVQSVRETADLGFATEEAIDAVHFALHELGVQYGAGSDTPVAVRSGPRGLVGVYALPPNELVDLAESAVSRQLTDAECATFLSGSCPEDLSIPDDLPLRGGLAAYGAVDPGPRALAGTSITMAASTLRGDEGFARELEAFTERTGIEVELIGGENEDVLSITTGDLDRPDIVGYQSGIPAWAQEQAMDISQFVDRETLRSDFGDYLLDIGTMGRGGVSQVQPDEIRAIPLTVDLKGLVFYPKAEFQAAGYRIPASWDELIEPLASTRRRRSHAVVLRVRQRVRQRVAGLGPDREPRATSGWNRRLRRVDRGRRRVREPGGDGSRTTCRRGGLRTRLRARRPGADQQRELRQPAVPHAESQRPHRRGRAPVLAAPPGQLRAQARPARHADR